MKIKKNNVIGLLVAIICVTLIPFEVAQSQEFPSKPVTIIVPFGPGGIIDLGARMISDRLSKELGVPVIIENKTGGAGLIGSTTFVKSTKADGYTLLAASAAAVITSVQLSNNPAFDPRKDLLPVGYIADAPCAMSVGKHVPVKSFKEFLEYTKNNPGKLRGGISSLGGETHIMFESIVKDFKINTKVVPYPKISPLIAAVMGGHLDWWCGTMPVALNYQKSGDMKILLLTRRDSQQPDIPTGNDFGFPDISVNVWMGLFALPKTPQDAYNKLVSAISVVANDSEISEKLSSTGFNSNYKNPSEFSFLIKEQWGIFDKVIKEANIKVQ